MSSNLHFEIPLYAIKEETRIPFNIYRKEEEFYSMIVEQNDIFPKKLASIISQSANKAMYIKNEDTKKYYSYLESVLGKITSDTFVSLKDKSKLIYDTSSKIVNDLFEKPESKEAIERSKKLVENTINIILSDDSSIRSMMEIGSHDYYTYTHSVDVAVFSIGFANYLNFSYEDISNIGNAAMMHDIGKSKIPQEIINKKGKLSDEEFEIMKTHPIHSYEILQFHNEKNEDILKAARNHHEKARGNGYPDKLTSKNTHTFAKIIAISDIFSALTTKRSYKDAFSSFEALRLMKTQMIDDIDKNLFIEFIKFMSKSSI
ncbi:HD-GYP domain-containing protein [Sulfurospirillum arcachonense]|uniref:HD-GYP domain-containing protein n=1 Tax=Sulfurospirillum arcachonense TaxID=57666 RepID=UPI000468AC50|nr:HD domain-containing phosphohydrolase [Sulfurospirillum arcachonense]